MACDAVYPFACHRVGVRVFRMIKSRNDPD